MIIDKGVMYRLGRIVDASIIWDIIGLAGIKRNAGLIA